MDLNSITLLSFALGVILILAAVIGKEIKIAAAGFSYRRGSAYIFQHF